jgi:hypothetical protein
VIGQGQWRRSVRRCGKSGEMTACGPMRAKFPHRSLPEAGFAAQPTRLSRQASSAYKSARVISSHQGALPHENIEPFSE